MLKPGDAAPDFVLPDADGKPVRLSTFSGKWLVVYFYPRDRTPGCTIEAKGFRDEFEALAEAGVVVVGVSLDDTESHCDFREKYDIPFHLLSDADGRIHDLYDAWRTRLFGRHAIGVRRCTFLVDPQGIIRYVYRVVQPVGHAKAVRAKLESLRSPQKTA